MSTPAKTPIPPAETSSDASAETATVYTLKHPFVARQAGADVEYAELPIPEVITVAMMRKIKSATTMLFAHELTEICAGLGPFEANKLATPDALGYTQAVSDLLEPRDEPGFVIPKISAFKPLLMKVTVDVDRRVEFVAQVLSHSGIKNDVINAMDYRDFAPAVALVLEMFPGPKT